MAELSTNAKMKYEDVTAEYLCSATPGVGTVTYDHKYDKERHQPEIDFSLWLHNTFGGDIHLLEEINQDKVSTPDYVWRGKLWDLKTTSTERSANGALRHGLKQIYHNPGGIILDYRGKQIDLMVLNEIICKRLWWCGNHPALDIMIVLEDDAVMVWRYSKRNEASPPPT